MATTTNYGWDTPDDTDLVKDGASAIRTLGSSADTTVKNLNPGTTAGDIDYYTSTTAKARVAIGTAGQVLKVNAGGTAPEWATTADQTPLTTKGDLFTFDTADARLGVGANGTVLTADSAEATGLKWAAPAAGGGMTLINSGGTTLSGASVTISSIPATYKNLQLIIRNFLPANDNKGIFMRFNGDSATRYAYSYATAVADKAYDQTELNLGYANDDTVATGLIAIDIFDYANTTTWKMASGDVMTVNETTTANLNYRRGFYAYNQIGAISSITLLPETGNFTSGTAFLYGVS